MEIQGRLQLVQVTVSVLQIKGWSTVSYHQSLAFDQPYLSFNDHCDRGLFQELFSEAVICRCSSKQVLLKILQYSQENICVGVLEKDGTNSARIWFFHLGHSNFCRKSEAVCQKILHYLMNHTIVVINIAPLILFLLSSPPMKIGGGGGVIFQCQWRSVFSYGHGGGILLHMEVCII